MDEYCLSTYNWVTNDFVRIPGTEDWEPVGDADSIGGYEWDVFAVFWSPSARRYFWGAEGGCSCNSFAQGWDASDYQSGARADVLRSLTAWRDDPECYNDARHDVADRLADTIRSHSRNVAKR